MKSFTLIMALVAIALHSIALAVDNTQIEIDSRDQPLTIRGTIGDKEGFIGNLRVTATGGDTGASGRSVPIQEYLTELEVKNGRKA